MKGVNAVWAFQLIRRLIEAGLSAGSIYLAIGDQRLQDSLTEELKGELSLRADASLVCFNTLEELLGYSEETRDPRVTLLDITNWSAPQIEAFDRNIKAVQTAAPAVIIFAGQTDAIELLRLAPNVRSRLNDMMELRPE